VIWIDHVYWNIPVRAYMCINTPESKEALTRQFTLLKAVRPMLHWAVSLTWEL
jgi:hypothetical protein